MNSESILCLLDYFIEGITAFEHDLCHITTMMIQGKCFNIIKTRNQIGAMNEIAIIIGAIELG